MNVFQCKLDFLALAPGVAVSSSFLAFNLVLAALAQVLIREICNSIIAQAVRYINGGDIFTMISSEETVECYAKLENTFRICTAFKAQPWRVWASLLWRRLHHLDGKHMHETEGLWHSWWFQTMPFAIPTWDLHRLLVTSLNDIGMG